LPTPAGQGTTRRGKKEKKRRKKVSSAKEKKGAARRNFHTPPHLATPNALCSTTELKLGMPQQLELVPARQTSGAQLGCGI
jgi:hypothetical protein